MGCCRTVNCTEAAACPNLLLCCLAVLAVSALAVHFHAIVLALRYAAVFSPALLRAVGAVVQAFCNTINAKQLKNKINHTIFFLKKNLLSRACCYGANANRGQPNKNR